MIYEFLKRWAKKNQGFYSWRHTLMCRLSSRFRREYDEELDRWARGLVEGLNASLIVAGTMNCSKIAAGTLSDQKISEIKIGQPLIAEEGEQSP